MTAVEIGSQNSSIDGFVIIFQDKKIEKTILGISNHVPVILPYYEHK